MTVHHLEINEDVKCKMCGKGGAVKTEKSDKFGLCLTCVNKQIFNIGRFVLTIGAKTIEKAKEEIGGLLDTYHESINKAYLQCDNDLTVSLSIKLQPGRPANSVAMTVTISYVESKVKAGSKILIEEKQGKLFDG